MDIGFGINRTDGFLENKLSNQELNNFDLEKYKEYGITFVKNKEGKYEINISELPDNRIPDKLYHVGLLNVKINDEFEFNNIENLKQGYFGDKKTETYLAHEDYKGVSRCAADISALTNDKQLIKLTIDPKKLNKPIYADLEGFLLKQYHCDRGLGFRVNGEVSVNAIIKYEIKDSNKWVEISYNDLINSNIKTAIIKTKEHFYHGTLYSCDNKIDFHTQEELDKWERLWNTTVDILEDWDEDDRLENIYQKSL